MRTTLIFLFLLLILWITGSSWWYVCRIRGDCQGNMPLQAEITTPGKQTEADDSIKAAGMLPEQGLNALTEEAKTYLTKSGIQKVYFEISSATADLNVIPLEFIEKLKLFLDNTPEATVLVTGHTDSSGPKSLNVKLSRDRTELIKNYLIDSGINAGQIKTSSKIDTEPAASNETPEGRAKNRRTEINIQI